MGYAQSNIKVFRPQLQKEHRTTIRVEKDRWTVFKKQVNEMGLTTCFVIRQMIETWLKVTYSERVLYEHRKEKGEYGWVYDKDLMSLMKIDHYGRYLALFPSTKRAIKP